MICFSRVPAPQRKTLQTKCKQLGIDSLCLFFNDPGIHYLKSYQPKEVHFLIVSDAFESTQALLFFPLVTGKLLQALIDCVFIVTPDFIDALLLPPSKASSDSSSSSDSCPLLLPNPLQFAPKQSIFPIDTSPLPKRASLFHSFTFHFVSSSSPYIEIVRSAQGVIHLEEASFPAPSDSCFVVFKELENSSESVLTDTQTVIMNRLLPEDVLEWVQNGWMPLEEQEVMKCVLHPMEFERIVEMSRQKRAKEREKGKKEMNGMMEMDSEKSTKSLEGMEQVNENERVNGNGNHGMSQQMSQSSNHGMNQQSNHGMSQQMNHGMSQQSNHGMNHEMNYEAISQSRNSHREPSQNSFREAIHHESLFQSSQPSSKPPLDPSSSLVSGAPSMASVPAVSIAVKRPGPVKSEEDVEDFFNALDSGSQMAVESQYVHQSKRTMEKRNPNALQKLDALDEKEEMDLMDEVDRMEMEIEEEKLRESQLSQSKTDSTSQFSSQTHVETRTPFSQPSLKPSIDPTSTDTSISNNHTHTNTHSNTTLTIKKPTSALPSSSSIEQRPFSSAPREASQSSDAGRSSNTVKLLDMEGSSESPILQHKGKRFVKHVVKKSSLVLSLTPYQSSSVCHKHFHKTTTTTTKQLFIIFCFTRNYLQRTGRTPSAWIFDTDLRMHRTDLANTQSVWDNIFHTPHPRHSIVSAAEPAPAP